MPHDSSEVLSANSKHTWVKGEGVGSNPKTPDPPPRSHRPCPWPMPGDYTHETCCNAYGPMAGGHTAVAISHRHTWDGIILRRHERHFRSFRVDMPHRGASSSMVFGLHFAGPAYVFAYPNLRRSVLSTVRTNDPQHSPAFGLQRIRISTPAHTGQTAARTHALPASPAGSSSQQDNNHGPAFLRMVVRNYIEEL